MHFGISRINHIELVVNRIADCQAHTGVHKDIRPFSHSGFSIDTRSDIAHNSLQAAIDQSFGADLDKKCRSIFAAHFALDEQMIPLFQLIQSRRQAVQFLFWQQV